MGDRAFGKGGIPVRLLCRPEREEGHSLFAGSGVVPERFFDRPPVLVTERTRGADQGAVGSRTREPSNARFAVHEAPPVPGDRESKTGGKTEAGDNDLPPVHRWSVLIPL